MGGTEPVGGPAAFEPAAPDVGVERVCGGATHVLIDRQVAGRIEAGADQVTDFPRLLRGGQRVQGRGAATAALRRWRVQLRFRWAWVVAGW